MPMSNRLQQYLERNNVRYDVLEHHPTMNSIATAAASGVPKHQLAKAVILQDHEGRTLMALLPASHKINIGKLSEDLCRDLRLVKEAQVYLMFEDCAKGAVPPLGDSYNMDLVFDDLLAQTKDIYLEGGDHCTLLHLDQNEFRRLMQGHRHSRFSAEVFH